MVRLRELLPGEAFRVARKRARRTYEVYERLWDWAFDERLPIDSSDPARIVQVDCFSPAGADPHVDKVYDYRFYADTEVVRILK